MNTAEDVPKAVPLYRIDVAPWVLGKPFRDRRPVFRAGPGGELVRNQVVFVTFVSRMDITTTPGPSTFAFPALPCPAPPPGKGRRRASFLPP